MQWTIPLTIDWCTLSDKGLTCELLCNSVPEQFRNDQKNLVIVIVSTASSVTECTLMIDSRNENKGLP